MVAQWRRRLPPQSTRNSRGMVCQNRYYVSQHAIKNFAGECKQPTRLPAHEVESRVTERLQGFLKSDGEIFDGLSVTGDSPAVLHPLVAAAKRLAARLPSLPSDDLPNLF